MATDTKMDVGFMEKLGEKFSNFAEGCLNLFTRVVGSSNDRQVRSLGYVRTKDPEKPFRITSGSLLAQINELEPKMQALSDAELKGLTPQFKERLANGETLDDLIPEAFAACREAGRRFKNMRHYDVQMIGGVVLHRGNIAEMVTGEGKTLVATLPAYLNALTGKGVHVITVNDYLARRDCEWMLPIYTALGVSAGYIQSDMDPMARREAYEKDITYGTNSEFGFDYLRDNMKPARHGDPDYNPWYHQVQRNHYFAIIDEVDNILIDEARTPLIISGPAFSDLKRFELANSIAVQLSEMEKKARAERETAIANGTYVEPEPEEDGKKGEKKPQGIYFEVKEKERTCHLTDKGVRKAEELAGVESFYTPGNMEWPHLIDNALKAHHLYHKDKNYLVMDHEGERKIVIIDEFTGRALFGRQWSDGLHQAIEAKHKRDGVAIKQETQTLATVTLQNFFKLYQKLAGMTGTAMTEAGEFWKIYKLDVIAIPTNRLLRRINDPDVVYRSQKEKWEAIMEEITRVHDQGRPILIGTTDVAKSELLSSMLKRKGIKHELLNAKPENVTRESEIVAQAGRRGAVTIATNMAGRGTDIILGGNPEYIAWNQLKQINDEDGRPLYPTRLEVPEDVWKKTVDAIEAKDKMKEAGREVAAMGGLHIIGTERHDSRRIDNQLRGRAGRQGDPGSSKFFISLQDDLMRLFGGEWVASVLTRLGMEEGQSIESGMVTKRIEGAQRKVEEYHFEQRKNLLDYDEVMDTQRNRVYNQRQEILNGRNCKLELLTMIEQQIDSAIERFLVGDYGPSSFAEFVGNRFGIEFETGEFTRMTAEEAHRLAKDRAINNISTFIQDAMDENLSEEDDPKDWKWQEMVRTINARYGLKFTDRQMKQIGRQNLSTSIFEAATESIEATDLSEGDRYLDPDWGTLSLIDWASQKFQIKTDLDTIKDQTAPVVRRIILDAVEAAYREKDILFPVQVAKGEFIAERSVNREGLFFWVCRRFPALTAELSEETFRTESKARILELITDISRKAYPSKTQRDIDAKLEDAFSGAKLSEAEDAKEVAEWMQETFQIEIPVEKLTGISSDVARSILWSAFDLRYRPEMRRVERNLLLEHLDSTWKSHLLTMDHLRSGINLWSFAQVDPKIKYKQEGMKEFDQMWDGLYDRVTDAIFRVEDLDSESQQEALRAGLWSQQTAVHAQAASLANTAATQPPPEPSRQQQQQTTNQSSDKKAAPIRNMNKKVGRNDPCPCGSGKKYKNCHMRQNTAIG